MNVTLPSNKLDMKAKIVYISIILICIVSIFLVVYIQFFEGKTIEIIGTLKGKSENDYNVLRSEFNSLLSNKLENKEEKYQSKKEARASDFVYTTYYKKENVSGSYDINVTVPYINLNNSSAKNYNKEIKEIFIDKTEAIMQTANKNSIYEVQYGAYMQDGILSVIIKTELQEGGNAQRTIIKTYNYDLENNREISLEELLKMKDVEISFAQNKIDKEIEGGNKKSQDLKEVGYPIYERDLDNDMYKVENVSEFYYHDGTIYIIFPYGNEDFTNEVDIAIL